MCVQKYSEGSVLYFVQVSEKWKIRLSRTELSNEKLGLAVFALFPSLPIKKDSERLSAFYKLYMYVR